MRYRIVRERVAVPEPRQGSAAIVHVVPPDDRDVAGVLGDRMPRRKILITVLTLLMLQSATLAVLTGLHLITLPALAFLALFAGVCNAFETPTRQSFYVQLLDKKEDLANAIALNSILMNGSRLIGPSIGGVLIASVGETACFAINAFSYLAVLAALFGIRVVALSRANAGRISE